VLQAPLLGRFEDLGSLVSDGLKREEVL